MSKEPTSGQSGVGRALFVLVSVAWLAVVAGAGFIGWWLGTSLAGRYAGAGAAAGVLLAPLAFCMLVERLAAARKREVRAERLLLPTMFVFALAVLALAVFAFPAWVGARLRALDDEGFIAEQGRSAGRLWLHLSPDPVSVEGTHATAEPQLDPVATSTPSAPLVEAPGAPQAKNPLEAPPKPVERWVGDRAYRENGTCESLADVSALERAYDDKAFRTSATALAQSRYPLGVPFLEAQDDATLRVWFTQGTDTFDGIVAGLEAAVHEGSHIWSAKRLNGRAATYRVAPDVDIQVRWLKNFHRSEILTLHRDKDSDSYADTYLTGSSGAQGFNTLLDEYNAYAHSLAVRWCTRDLLPSNQSVSSRDGMLTMMYYVELYLALARTVHPGDYAAILADEGHRRMITLVWDRAEYLLRQTEAFPALGLRDEELTNRVYSPELVSEIQRVRQR